MGLSFGEMVVLAVIALVVIGPKDLPKLLRAAGRMIGQARRAISDVKRETGLDEVLRGDFRDLERLLLGRRASRARGGGHEAAFASDGLRSTASIDPSTVGALASSGACTVASE